MMSVATEREISFVKLLGFHVDYRGRKLPDNGQLPRKVLLERYLAGCRKRARWDEIDGGAVILTIEEEIRKEAKKH